MAQGRCRKVLILKRSIREIANGIQVVGGSNPLASTKEIKGLAVSASPFFVPAKPSAKRSPANASAGGFRAASRDGGLRPAFAAAAQARRVVWPLPSLGTEPPPRGPRTATGLEPSKGVPLCQITPPGCGEQLGAVSGCLMAGVFHSIAR